MQRLEAGAAQIIMEEKRAHKVRKSGGGRKKRKPDYDAGKNLKEQMESAVALYNTMSLQAIADELSFCFSVPFMIRPPRIYSPCPRWS